MCPSDTPDLFVKIFLLRIEATNWFHASNRTGSRFQDATGSTVATREEIIPLLLFGQLGAQADGG